MATLVDLMNIVATDLRGVNLASQTNISDFIQGAINRTIIDYTHELFWFNTRISYTITNPDQPLADYISLPVDYAAIISDPSLIDAGTGTLIRRATLQRMSNEDIDLINVNGNKSTPRFFTIIGNQLRVGPIPDAQYRIQIQYIKKYPLLVLDTDSNDWTATDNAPNFLRYMAGGRLAITMLRNKQLGDDLRGLAQEELALLRQKTIDYLSLEGIKPNDL